MAQAAAVGPARHPGPARSRCPEHGPQAGRRGAARPRPLRRRDGTRRDPERVAVPGSDPLERPDRTPSSTRVPVSAGPALNTAAIAAIIEREAARS
jgi:hypothetical protein